MKWIRNGAPALPVALMLAVLGFAGQRCSSSPTVPTASGSPTPTPDINEYSVPTGDSQPGTIVTGPDNNLWFTEMQAGQIGRAVISPSVSITEVPIPTPTGSPAVSEGPADITVGPDGNLWFTDMDGANLGTITTAGVINELALPAVTQEPSGITLGPDGNIWFAESNGSQIGRDGPGIDEFPTTTGNAMPTGIVKGPDGNLWFVETTANNIGVMTTAGAMVAEYSIPTASAGAAAITVGSDGALWFIEALAGKIGRITTAGVITEFSPPTGNSGPSGIVAGPDCNLWFTEAIGNNLASLNPATATPAEPGILEYAIPTAASQPGGITVGPDGNLWFTESAAAKIGQYVMPAGSSTSCLTNTIPPVALCQDVTVDTDPGVCTASAASINNGSCDSVAAALPTTNAQTPAGPYSLGTTPATLTLTDKNGLVSACHANITVVDKTPPVLTCPTLMPVQCTSPAGATVTLSATATDKCVGVGAPSCTPASGSTFPLGVDTFTCTATDTAGNTGSCTSTVTVQDTTPPTISAVTASPKVLWPPDGRRVPVTVTVTVSDTCDPAPKCKLTSITSNQKISAEDARITGNLTAVLEADDNPGWWDWRELRSDRVYTLNVQCSDASGNTATANTTVVVPPWFAPLWWVFGNHW